MEIVKRLFLALGAMVLFLLALFLGNMAFNKILDFRMLERIPLTTVLGSTEGEVQLRGAVSAANKPLLAPKTSSECVYYRYLVEKESKDSEGRTTWSTVRDERKSVDFFLEDASGKIYVAAGQATSKIDWGAAQKYRYEQNRYRYTEWRIDPNDQVTLFGWLAKKNQNSTISFFQQGDYLPIVSVKGAAAERDSMGWSALVILAAAVASLIFSAYLLVYSLHIHKVLVLLFLVSSSSTAFLWYYGWQSMESDVRSGYERLKKQVQRSNAAIAALLQAKEISATPADVLDLEAPRFNALTEQDKNKIRAWRISSYQVRERYLKQISQFPERSYAKINDLNKPADIPLSSAQSALAQQQASQFQSTRVGNKWWLNIVCGLLVALGSWWAFRFIKVKRILENLPTSKTNGVTYGLTEVAGVLKPDSSKEPLTAPLTHAKCCWYHYKVEEKQGSGKNAKWVTVVNQKEKQPFYCEDEEGRIRVFPSHAEVITAHIKKKREGRRRYSEWRLSPNDRLFILGRATVDKSTGSSLVLRNDKDFPFIVSNKPEKVVMLKKAVSGMGLLSLATSAVFFSLLILLGQQGRFSSLDFVLASFAGPIFFAMVMLIIMFNDLVFLRQRYQRAWANIQVSLKKRANLVPRLEKVAKAYLQHERSLLENISFMRQQVSAGNSLQGVDRYMQAEQRTLDQLNVVLEQYPQLKSDGVMADLHRRIVILENEISMMRAGFNDSVMQYNTRIAQFPDNLLARCFGFKRTGHLQFEQKVHKVPAV